jgi:hypothetical protein
MAQLVPVDYNPFETVQPNAVAQPKLVPVDYNPFEQAQPQQAQATQQVDQTKIGGVQDFAGNVLNNFVGGVQAIGDLAFGNFETPLNPQVTPATQNLADKLFPQGSEGTLGDFFKNLTAPDLKDYSAALLEKFGANPAGKAVAAVGGLVPAMNVAGSAYQTFARPAILKSGIAPENLDASLLVGGGAIGAKQLAKGKPALPAKAVAETASQLKKIGVTPEQVVNTMQQAQKQGINLTLPEASAKMGISPTGAPYASGNTLINRQRVIEQSSTPAADIVNQAKAGRAGQITDIISKQGKAIVDAGEAAAKPLYEAVRGVTLDKGSVKALVDDPIIKQAIGEISKDSKLKFLVKDLPKNSVGFFDEVKKYLDAEKQSSTLNNRVKSLYTDATRKITGTLDEATSPQKSLPMDTASRMARAKEMGFDTETPLYHGTDAKFKKFKEGTTFLTDNKDVASGYGDNVVKSYVKLKDPLVFDFEGKSTLFFDGKWRTPSQLASRVKEISDDLSKRFQINDELMDEISQYGYDDNSTIRIDGAILKNIDDVAKFGDKPVVANHYAIFDPENIRAQSAAFNPEDVSANLIDSPITKARDVSQSQYAQARAAAKPAIVAREGIIEPLQSSDSLGVIKNRIFASPEKRAELQRGIGAENYKNLTDVIGIIERTQKTASGGSDTFTKAQTANEMANSFGKAANVARGGVFGTLSAAADFIASKLDEGNYRDLATLYTTENLNALRKELGAAYAKTPDGKVQAVTNFLQNKLPQAVLKAAPSNIAIQEQSRDRTVQTPPVTLPNATQPSTMDVVPFEQLLPEAQPVQALPETKPQSSIDGAINEAAQIGGIDRDLLQAIAETESSLNPNAQAKTSSATGLFQITKDTWRSLVKKHGDEYGIAMRDIRDPRANAIMASLLTKDNAEKVSRALGREVSAGEAYIAHFMGASGAVRLLQADPAKPAYKLFPKQAKANQSIFFAGKQPRSAGEVADLLASKVENKIQQRQIQEQPAPQPTPQPTPLPEDTMLANIPLGAIQELRKNPDNAAQFDEVFGNGMAQLALR